jgi:hypothetical protein
MSRAPARKKPAPSDGPIAGERWTTGRGDAGRLDIVGVRRVAIADFGLGGAVPSDVAYERAQLAAQAPRMYEALLASVSEARECGYFDQEPYHPKVGCDCGECQGLRALALAEGGGRCILCGCTEFDACAGRFGDGCAWADDAELVCSAHPEKMIAAAQAYVRKELRRG